MGAPMRCQFPDTRSQQHLQPQRCQHLYLEFMQTNEMDMSEAFGRGCSDKIFISISNEIIGLWSQI